MTAKPVPLTEAVSEFVVHSDTSTLPEAALGLAERALLDTVGVALAATSDPTVAAMWAALGQRLPPGPSSVLTQQRRTQPHDAALLNGTAAHALDYDDVVDDLIGHPSSVLIPTALASAEESGASGGELLHAYCVGYQVENALAAGLSIDRHYARGWHSTATLGVVAATATAARLLGLDTTQVRHALGIAGSLAGGSRRNFGTMTKPLHAGLAATHGIQACLLALSDFTADPEHLEAPLGYFALYGEEVGLEASLRMLQGPWLLDRRGLNVKRFPCCYYAHRAAGAALHLAHDALEVADVEDVVVTVQPGGLAPLIHHTPLTGLQGKFSLEYIVAACLLDRELTLGSFTDSSVRRDSAQRLLSVVRVEESDVPAVGPPQWEGGYAAVRVRTRHGDCLGRRLDIPPGHALAPLSEQELTDKFGDCLSFSSRTHDGAELCRRLRSVRDEPTVSGLFDGVVPRAETP